MTINKSLINFKNLCIVLLLIACIFLWFKTCHPSTTPPPITQNQQANDSVAKLLAVVQESNIREGVLREDSMTKAKAIQDKDVQLVNTQNKLAQANKQATALANEVSDAHIHNDTLGFIKSCDSLALVTLRDNFLIDSIKRVTRSVMNARDAALINANSAKSELRAQTNGYKSAVALLQKTNDNLAKALNPTRKVYIGLEGFTSVAVSGVGPGLMYQDLRSLIYGLSGGIATTGGWWIGGKVYMKIQLHK